MSKVDHLWMITTVSEVMQVFELSKSAVTYAIEENKVRNRKAGGTWILSMEDALKRWGRRLDTDTIIEIQMKMTSYKDALKRWEHRLDLDEEVINEHHITLQQ